MRAVEIGVMIVPGRVDMMSSEFAGDSAPGVEPATTRWSDIRALAVTAESLGLDAVWIPDELFWRADGEEPKGAWEAVAIAGAVAAVTSRIKIGTWVMSALHRNPGITAKVAETLDEISGGRFVFGLGAGHTWPGQARALGLPEDHVYERFEEALEIIVPLLRGGHADFEGTYHAARNLVQTPTGPRPNQIPIMLAAHGPKGLRHAARVADIWSCYAKDLGDVAEFAPRLQALESACAEVGRDPATIGRSAGLWVAPLAGADAAAVPPDWVTGSAEQIADRLRSLGDVGFTHLELVLGPQTIGALEALAPVLKLLDEA